MNILSGTALRHTTNTTYNVILKDKSLENSPSLIEKLPSRSNQDKRQKKDHVTASLHCRLAGAAGKKGGNLNFLHNQRSCMLLYKLIGKVPANMSRSGVNTAFK